jgi:hypothetical protein
MRSTRLPTSTDHVRIHKRTDSQPDVRLQIWPTVHRMVPSARDDTAQGAVLPSHITLRPAAWSVQRLPH